MFALLLVHVPPGVLAQEASMPQYYYAFEGDPHAAWVAADSALDAKGEPDSALFSESAVWSIKRYRERQKSEGACVQLGKVYIPDQIELDDKDGYNYLTDDFASTVKAVDWIFEGIITGSTPGFNGPIPGTLLRVRHENTLKGTEEKTGQYYFFVPVAEFTVGDLRLCKTDQSYPEVPEIGDRVILMAYLHLLNSRSFLWIQDKFIVVKRNGSMSFPEIFGRPGPNKKAVLGQIEKILGGGKKDG